MGYVRINMDNSDILDDIKKLFGDYEDFVVDNTNPFNPDDVRCEVTFYADEEDIIDDYVELCKKYPTTKIDMAYDNDEGFVTYYENDDGRGHECWIEQYDVEEI